MKIHTIINMREDFQEFINMTNELHARFKLKNPNKRPNLNLIQLVIEGQKKLNEQLINGKEICYECSKEANKNVYHFINPVFQEFREKKNIKRHANQLQILADYFFN